MRYRTKVVKIVLVSLLAIGTTTIPSAASPFISMGVPSPANEIEGYKKWTRVNRSPVLGDQAAMKMCSVPIPITIRETPHKDKYINVYVNDIGRAAMTKERSPKFPAGSMIVKEKLATAEAPAPELLTAMVKREAGFNADGGDWEYLVLSGDAKTIQAQGKLETCMACHATKRNTGYVFRDYLNGEDWSKLK